jgi:hypothetical protein
MRLPEDIRSRCDWVRGRGREKVSGSKGHER